MMSGPVLSAVALGFVLGLQHAIDPDHVVAVATIVTRERRFADGALVGVLWGLGHAATLTVAGAVLIALNAAVRPETGRALELLVAACIIALGALRLRDALRGVAAASREHLLVRHDHVHGDEGAFHSHVHEHGSARHAHPHVHPSRRLLAALAGRRVAARALAIGAVHGLAGTAAVSLLVLATLRSPLEGVLYLLVFGAGTIAGMTALTAALAWPISLAMRFRGVHRVLSLGSGLAAIAFGLWYAGAMM